ncbi:MAG: hypothetical protein WC223_13795 [Bacteroidales bacterium]
MQNISTIRQGFIKLKQMENAEMTTNTAENKAMIGKLYKSFITGIKSCNAVAPKEWMQKRKLSTEITGAGFNSGQIHHRKEQQFKDELESIGFITKSNSPTNKGQQAYKIFGNYSIIFPLKNENNEVVNFHAISVETGKTEYLNNDGIYPNYPSITTIKLFIAPTTLETATVLESKTLKENEAVISLFDNKFKQQHFDAISKLKQLQEIIFITKK